ncbi:MAG: helix-turn-helix domain-containing protein [Lachnospiraceae bacterium]|nr:helix-turn-helix domain-containing protein [Lachnospiraceae bacterium]
MDKFSSRIKELRKKSNQTQSQFAEFIGTTQGALSGYENGDRTPSYEILIAIAQKCNVSIDWLCGLSDKMTLNDQITTYKEFFRLFLTAFDIKYQIDAPVEFIETIIDTINADKMSVLITLHADPNFQSFFSKWYDIFKLHREGTIDDDLYEMWIEKQLKEYDRPIDGLPPFMHD